MQPMQPMQQPTQPLQQQQQQQPQQAPTSRSAAVWQACRGCCSMASYKQYFDVETVDISTRLKGVWTEFYKPEAFRNEVLGVMRTETTKGPDLYGPFWVTMTLVFFLAVTSNLAAYLHSNNLQEYEYDITHLIRAMSVLTSFAFGVPTLFWLGTQCLGMQALCLADWVCLYGYSLVPYVPATLLCLIPSEVSLWIVLLITTSISCLLVVRNVAGPLLAADVSQTKAGPLLMAILACHVILLLVLKVGFYH